MENPFVEQNQRNLKTQSVPRSKHTHSLGYKNQSVMMNREIIAVCSEIHTKNINTLCGQKVELVNVEPGGTYRGADKSLDRAGRKQARKHARDARDFNKIEMRPVIKILLDKAPKEIHAILTETLACLLPGRVKDLSPPLYSEHWALRDYFSGTLKI